PSDASPFGSAALTFVNNSLSAPGSATERSDKFSRERTDLPPGVIVTTLAEAAVKHADLLKAHFMVQPQKLGSEKFAALHAAFVGDGAFIYVPRGVEVPSSI